MYQVLARKWRPRTLEELVGQQHVTRTLANAIRSGRLAHAYVFAGVRGTGKTTVARILAKCLNCHEGLTPTPCDACPSCLEIAEGRSMDVLEIDAASRTHVEDVRELQEVIAYAPVRDRYKVMIVDEAHMLSRHAFNALLKTLEEPPPRVVFVLATTEPQKLLPTILSRCQVYEFRRLAVREVAAHLRRVCDAEGVAASDATLERIARAGEGSVRDSLSVLERVLAFCGESVGDDEALQILGSVRTEILVRVVRGIAERDAAAMLRALDLLVEEGHDLLHFWSELLGVLRDLMVARTLPDREDVLSRSAEEALVLTRAAEGLGIEDLNRAFRLLADLEPALKGSSQPRYLFEAALIGLASLGAVRPIEEILAALSAEPPPSPATPPPRGRPSGGSSPASDPSGKRPPDGPAPRPRAGAASATGDAAAFLAAVKRARPMLAAAAEQADVRVGPDGVTLSFAPSSEAFRGIAERGESLDVFRRCASEVLGRPSAARVAPAGAPASAPEPDAGASGDDGAAPAVPDEPSSLLERARSDPGIRRLLSEFGAQVVEIRPLEPGEGEDGGRTDAAPEEAP